MGAVKYCHRCDELCELHWHAPCYRAFDAENCEFMNRYRERNNMTKSDQEFKADAGKPNPLLLEVGCWRALRVVQATLDYGNIKYEAHSWINVPDGMRRYDAAARRHRNARDSGQLFDRESNLPHIGHEIISNLFLLDLMIRDDASVDWAAFNTRPPQDHKPKPWEGPCDA